jgi:hypothetical protein
VQLASSIAFAEHQACSVFGKTDLPRGLTEVLRSHWLSTACPLHFGGNPGENRIAGYRIIKGRLMSNIHMKNMLHKKNMQTFFLLSASKDSSFLGDLLGLTMHNLHSNNWRLQNPTNLIINECMLP